MVDMEVGHQEEVAMEVVPHWAVVMEAGHHLKVLEVAEVSAAAVMEVLQAVDMVVGQVSIFCNFKKFVN